MADTIFTKILSGDIPSHKVYEDDKVFAFLDISPLSTGHTLVIPKVHFERIADLEPGIGSRLFTVGMELSKAIQLSANSDGINLFVADGVAAGQEVAHFHLHIIPRYKGDGFVIRPNYPPKPSRETLEQTAELIRKALAASL